MKGKTELVPCEICGRPIVRSEHGGYSYCENCGWRRGGDNEGSERQWGISYPMLVSLSHARAQYRQGLPFKADLDEFVNGALFYGEMLFDFGGETYEVYLYRDANGEPYRFVLCGEGIRQEYPTEKDFKEKANIRGKRLKDIWDLVRDPRFM